MAFPVSVKGGPFLRAGELVSVTTYLFLSLGSKTLETLYHVAEAICYACYWLYICLSTKYFQRKSAVLHWWWIRHMSRNDRICSEYHTVYKCSSNIDVKKDAPWCQCNHCWPKVSCTSVCDLSPIWRPRRLDRLNQAAKELSGTTGQRCMAAQADVRQITQLQDAVTKTIQEFGRIDYVICGKLHILRQVTFCTHLKYRCGG